VLARRAEALTRGGAIAAWAVGTVVLTGTGWAGGAVLAAFFVSSNLVGRLTPGLSADIDAKGERRDPWQVLANGGPALLGSLIGFRIPDLGFWILTASLAGAAADTWATGVGAWSPQRPRRLLLGRPVPPGTSGGMTVLGTVGALAGALLVAATGALAGAKPALLAAGTLIGFAGMVFDSVLGATAQGRFRCPGCGASSERRVHRCGAPTVREGGLQWLDNDGVNLLATTLAAVLGAGAWRVLSR
jgi:uncharacterized protein (TIGR00297 family)